MDQPPLPFPRAGICRFSVAAFRTRETGWNIEVWHQHLGVPGNCPGRWVYTDLSLDELRQLVEDTLSPAQGPYHGEGDECHPGPHPRT